MAKDKSVAVFTDSLRELNAMVLIPKENFTLIRSTQSLIGREFMGVMLLHDWERSNSLRHAYEYLKDRQPELFK